MRILITGGAGFIGSHLTKSFLAAGHAVTVIDDLSTGNRQNLDHAQDWKGFRFVEASVTDASIVRSLVDEAEFVYHLAAVVGVERVISDPVGTLETNILGTRNLFEEAAARSVPVAFASTSEVYGNHKNNSGILTESSHLILGPPTQPRASYAASKIVGELLASNMHQQSGFAVCCLRLFSVIGVPQSPAYGMVLPRFVTQAIRGEPITVYGSGLQTRCFTAINDVVRMLQHLLDRRFEFDVINYGSDRETSILDLAHLVRDLANSDSKIQMIPFSDAFESAFEDSERRVPDLSHMKQSNFPLPEIELEQVIEDVIAFFRSRLDLIPDEAQGH